MNRRILVLIFLTGGSAYGATAVTIGARTGSLQSVTFEVQGEPRLVMAGGSLIVVRGDSLKVTEATLTKPGLVPKVNVIGFSRTGSIDDLGQTIDSSSDFMTGWSIDGQGNRYRVEVTDGRAVYGEVFIVIIEPSLNYLLAEVNGRQVVWRPGDPVHLGKKDKLRIVEVKTNVSSTNEVTLDVLRADDPEQDASYEMGLSRGSIRFARIPVHM